MTEVGVCMGSGNRIHLKPKTTMTEVGVCMGRDRKQDPPKTQDNNDRSKQDPQKTQDNNDRSGCLYGK